MILSHLLNQDIMNSNFINILLDNEKNSILAITELMKAKDTVKVYLGDDSKQSETEIYVWDQMGLGCDCETVTSVELTKDGRLRLNTGSKRVVYEQDCHPGTFPYIHLAVFRKLNAEMIDFLSRPIESLGLKTITVNSLHREGVNTVADLVMCKEWKLRKTRGISKKTLSEMNNMLKDQGFVFNSDLRDFGFKPKDDVWLHNTSFK